MQTWAEEVENIVGVFWSCDRGCLIEHLIQQVASPKCEAAADALGRIWNKIGDYPMHVRIILFVIHYVANYFSDSMCAPYLNSNANIFQTPLQTIVKSSCSTRKVPNDFKNQLRVVRFHSCRYSWQWGYLLPRTTAQFLSLLIKHIATFSRVYRHNSLYPFVCWLMTKQAINYRIRLLSIIS